MWIEEPLDVAVIDVPAPEANWVLAAYMEGGYKAGSFTMALIDAMRAADAQNFAKLKRMFPTIAAAVSTAQHELGGIDRLRYLAHPDREDTP